MIGKLLFQQGVSCIMTCHCRHHEKMTLKFKIQELQTFILPIAKQVASNSQLLVAIHR